MPPQELMPLRILPFNAQTVTAHPGVGFEFESAQQPSPR
jgi:hypothetical protein